MGAQPLRKLPVASPFCQRWLHGRHSWTPRHAGGFDPARYQVAAIDHATTRAYVTTHHYSRTYVADRFRLGLYHLAGGGIAVRCS